MTFAHPGQISAVVHNYGLRHLINASNCTLTIAKRNDDDEDDNDDEDDDELCVTT